MYWEKLSLKAEAAVEEAIDTASEHGHSGVTSLHILQALLNQDGGVLTGFLHYAGGEYGQVYASVEAGMEQLPRLRGSAAEAGASEEFYAMMSGAWRVAHKLEDERLAPEHLVFAMVEAPADQAGAILREQRLSVLLVTCCLLAWRQSQSDLFV